MTDKIKEEKNVLEIELLQVGEILFGRVKNQDESLRSGVNYENDNVTITSSGAVPQISIDGCRKLYLYIRGYDKKGDYRTFLWQCKTEKEATKWAEKIKVAVGEFNKDPTNKPVPPTEPLKCKRIMG